MFRQPLIIITIVHADVMNLISSASDDVFYQKLADLNSAVKGLQRINSVVKDGSMNYPICLFLQPLALQCQPFRIIIA